MFGGGVRAHYVTTVLCARLLRATPGSLVVTVSMEAGSRHQARHGVAYSVAKAADDRLALALSVALAPDGVASVALYPGLVRTEGVLRFAEHLDLAADAAVMSLTGCVLTVTDLARRYAADPAT